MNVAFLPGIVGRSLAMPDIHQGYGFPIGGVAATDIRTRSGVAGRRGIRHQLRRAIAGKLARARRSDAEIARAGEPALPRRAVRHRLQRNDSVGLRAILNEVLEARRRLDGGARLWRAGRHRILRGIRRDGGRRSQQSFRSRQAARAHATRHARQRQSFSGSAVRGKNSGAGNRGAFRIAFEPGGGADSLRLARPGPPGLHRFSEDDERSDAPLSHHTARPPARLRAACTAKKGKIIWRAMAAAANFAWANRQAITHFTRGAFRKIFGGDPQLRVVYDVAHNIAKRERHRVNGEAKRKCWCIAKARRDRFPQARRDCRPRTAKPASPC